MKKINKELVVDLMNEKAEHAKLISYDEDVLNRALEYELCCIYVSRIAKKLLKNQNLYSNCFKFDPLYISKYVSYKPNVRFDAKKFFGLRYDLCGESPQPIGGGYDFFDVKPLIILCSKTEELRHLLEKANASYIDYNELKMIDKHLPTPNHEFLNMI